MPGRYDEISRCDRICHVCGLNIEDEIHFLFNCPKYSSIRDDFNSKIDNRIPNNKHTNFNFNYIANELYWSLSLQVISKISIILFSK